MKCSVVGVNIKFDRRHFFSGKRLKHKKYLPLIVFSFHAGGVHDDVLKCGWILFNFQTAPVSAAARMINGENPPRSSRRRH